MASLTNTKIKDTYDGLLKTTDNNALGGTYKLITDGLGNSSGVYLGTGGNVGIGENVPSKPLTINKNQSETAILVQSSDTGVSGIYLGGQSDSIKGGLVCDNSDNSIKLQGYNNETRLFVKSDGKIGINTTDPAELLTVSASDDVSIRINSTKNGTWTTNQKLGALEFFGNDSSSSGAGLKGYINLTSVNTFGAAFNMNFGVGDNATDRMVITHDGDVGLGENNPDRQLHLKSSLPAIRLEDSDVSGLYHEFFASTSGFFQFKADGGNVQPGSGFLFQVDNSEKMRIDSNGNVGIGTLGNADEKLHIQGSVDNDDIALKIENTFDDNSSATPPSAAVVFSTASNNGYIRVFGAPANTAANHKMDIGATAGSSYLTFSPNGSEKMRIASDGNVGIGTTDPQKLLHIASPSAQSVITLQRTNTNTSGAIGALQWTALDNHTVTSIVALGDGNNEGAHLQFNTTSAASGDNPFGISERMRIHSGGTVLVGKTSSSSTTTGVELNPVGLVQVTRNNNLPLLVNRTGSDGTVISIRNDGSTVGTISVSGSTTSYNTSSDYRLKENVVDMTGALDRVEQLQPKRFNFISNAETTVDGFIAHEVQSVIPEAVFGEKDAVDEDGNPEYQGIDQSKVVPLLVGAIKELKAEIEILKSQINS